jgi:hypothetical protein
MAVTTLYQNEANVKARERMERRKNSPYVGNKNTKLLNWRIEKSYFGALLVTGYRSDNQASFRAQLIKYMPEAQRVVTDQGIIKVKDEDGKIVPS